MDETKRTEVERFFYRNRYWEPRWEVNPITGCWLWLMYINKDGYGRLKYPGTQRLVLAHVALWEFVNGPKPAGMELDHKCKTRHCVNPEHMELVTHLENIRRGDNTIIDKELATKIREEFVSGGIKKIELARKYGLSRWSIYRIIDCEPRYVYNSD